MADEAVKSMENVMETMETSSSPEEPANIVEAVGEQPPTVEVNASPEISATNSGFCCSFVANMDPRVRELIFWTNPVKSGAVFGVSMALLSMVRCCGLLGVASFLGLVLLSLSFLIHTVSTVAKRFLSMTIPNPLLPFFSTPIEIPEEMVQCVSTRFAKSAESASRELCRLYTIVDIPDSFKFGVSMWLVYFVTSRMNFLTMIMIAEVIVFTVPKIYNMNQVQIDAAMSATRVQSMQMLEKARDVPLVDQCLKALAPKEKQA